MREAGAAAIQAVRVWPARDYTRITLELDRPLKYNYSILGNPNRVLVTFEGLRANQTLLDLIRKIRTNDPYVKRVRIGPSDNGVTRVVFDLKQPVRPDLFTLAPIDQYRHRLA